MRGDGAFGTAGLVCGISHKFAKILRKCPLAEKDNDCRSSNRCVLAGKGEAAGLPVDAETGDGVGPLVTRVKEMAAGIDIETAGIIASSPFLAGKSQHALVADGKESDAVVQPVS